jgi:hypothetical protein
MHFWKVGAAFLLCLPLAACKPAPETHAPRTFQQFVQSLPVLNPGFTYFPLLEDDERAYHLTDADAAFWPTPWPILGVLEDTSKYYLILSLLPGDDHSPVLMVVSHEGLRLDSVSIGHNWCPGWDCSTDSCHSQFKVVQGNAIETLDIFKSSDCDEAGAKVKGTAERLQWKDRVSVDALGRIVVQEIQRDRQRESVSVEDWRGSFYMEGKKPGEGYWQKLELQPEGDSISVVITSKLIKERMCCSFSSHGFVDGDTLRVLIARGDESAMMTLYPIDEGIGVWCNDFDDRIGLLGCCGGGNLVGDYWRE